MKERKEFNNICEMFTEYMAEYSKSGIIRFLTELTLKLRENGVLYTVESLDNEIQVKDVSVDNPSKLIVCIDGIPRKYTEEEITSMIAVCEDIKYCKEHNGEHLHSEEHLKIMQLRQETECLKRNSSEKDKMIENLKNEAREMKEKIGKMSGQHQSDCIRITQLCTALDVMVERYQNLREIHGL